MMQTLLYALGASLPLVVGAAVGARWRPPQPVVATALAFAVGALLAAVSFDLFPEAFEANDTWKVGIALAAGALVFVIADSALDRHTARSGSVVGLALLAGVTLDGIPENTALGVSLNESASVALLVAVFVSNFPEALAGAVAMRDNGRSPRAILALWAVATLLLAAAVFLGRYLFGGASAGTLSYPLAFAAGAVIASVIDTAAPEAFKEGGPYVALASTAGFLMGYLLS